MNLSKIWVVEYSVSQKCFHVDKLDVTVKSNFDDAKRGLSTDYIPVAVCRSHDAAIDISKALRVLLCPEPRAELDHFLKG